MTDGAGQIGARSKERLSGKCQVGSSEIDLLCYEGRIYYKEKEREEGGLNETARELTVVRLKERAI